MHFFLKGIYLVNSTNISSYHLLKSIYGEDIAAWKFYSIEAGSYPAKLRLQMLAYPYYNFVKPSEYSDVAIDDIEWIDCSSNLYIETDMPINCDFEKGMCSYHNDPSAVIMWTRKTGGSTWTGAPYDHTTKKGFYVQMTVSITTVNKKPARLMSSIQTKLSNQDVCFEFWYYMFGDTVCTKKYLP